MNNKKLEKSCLIITGMLIISGIIFLLKPDISITAIEKILGILLIVLAVFNFYNYRHRLFGFSSRYEIIMGILSSIIGILFVIRSDQMLNFLCILFGIFVLTEALIRVIYSFELKKMHINSWLYSFILSVINVVIGILLIVKPAGSAQFIIRLIGAALISSGLSHLYFFFRIRNNNNVFDNYVIDVEHKVIEQ